MTTSHLPPALLLIDQTEISMSHNATSLFINGHQVCEASNYNDFDIEDLAGKVSKALNPPLIKCKLTEKMLAESIAGEELDESDYFDRLAGYNDNELVLAATKAKPTTESTE